MTKTAVVRVDHLKQHPKYKKYYKVSKKYKAHVEGGDYKPGDEVIIQETRPLSKEKHWKIVELVRRPVSVEAVVDEVVPEKNA